MNYNILFVVIELNNQNNLVFFKNIINDNNEII